MENYLLQSLDLLKKQMGLPTLAEQLDKINKSNAGYNQLTAEDELHLETQTTDAMLNGDFDDYPDETHQPAADEDFKEYKAL